MGACQSSTLRNHSMKKLIELYVNGDAYQLAIEPRRTLLDVLRRDLGLTGTKKGCNHGECGACTVLIDGQPILACTTLAIACEGKRIETIEGLAKNGEMHPLQEAFVRHGAIQCGFCTPGMILSAKALFDRNPHPDEGQIRRAIAGNLCRCTGYVKIVEAIQSVAQRGAKGTP